MSCKIVVISCDKNKDLFKPYHICIEKYWKEHPPIIYSTESVVNPYYETICLNYDIGSWTKRVADTIKDLDCEHILLMVDDIFLREQVDNDRFNKLFDFFFDIVLIFLHRKVLVPHRLFRKLQYHERRCPVVF